MKNKGKNDKTLFITLGVIVLIALAVIIGVTIKQKSIDKVEVANNNLDSSKVEEKEEVKEEAKEEAKPEIKIFNGNDRPMAFMIDNNKNAQPQASLNSTYMVYEIIVEGGESRLMALFKGVDADQVGPIRSSRHYFLDYASENDAIYAHLGMSPQAEADFGPMGINNINGQIYDTGKSRTSTSLYWRATHKHAPHNAYTNTKNIKEICKQRGYRTTSDKESVLNYVPEEVTLDSYADAKVANSIVIPYHGAHKVQYKYDANTKRYTRYSKGKMMKDEMTKEPVTTKNIIVTFAKNYDLVDKEKKGRQNVETVGTLKGYYLTNGKAIEIQCVKKSRKEQTKYLDMQGNEIKVNDGNTWVNICPIDSNVVISDKI